MPQKAFLSFQLALERVQFNVPLGDEAHLVSTLTPIRGTQQAHQLTYQIFSEGVLPFSVVVCECYVVACHIIVLTD